MTLDIIDITLSILPPSNPITGIFSPGGVIRDKKKTTAWIGWYSLFQANELSKDDRTNFFMQCYLLATNFCSTMNIVYELRPNQGEGGIIYRTYVTRLSEEDYLCFEY